MGRCPTRKVKKRRLSHKTARRDKFEVKGDDLVYTELRKPETETKPLELSEDLPGMGQFYCLHCEYVFIVFVFHIVHFFFFESVKVCFYYSIVFFGLVSVFQSVLL